MAVMIPMLVVIAEHSPVIGRAGTRIDIGEGVFRDFTVLQPDLALQVTTAALAGQARNFREVLHLRFCLPLPRHPRNSTSIDI